MEPPRQPKLHTYLCQFVVYFQDGDITLVIPYISITSTGAVTLLSGTPNRISGGGGTGVSGGGKKKPGAVLPSPTSESGLGDIILRGRYYLLDERGPFPTIAITGRIKFQQPTRIVAWVPASLTKGSAWN